MKALVEKYNRPIPRYTSYPPVPYWKGNVSSESWVNSLNQSLATDPRLDIYIHIPFCEQLCYYCGCNRIITKDKSSSHKYVRSILHEWSLYLSRISEHFEINSIHLGGGTPTFLTVSDLDSLLAKFRPHLGHEFIGSVEIDPRTCSPEQIRLFRSYGFKRASLGIQDFDEEVQKKIHRSQSFSLVQKVVSDIRHQGIHSLNFDLIYGLPKQTKESIASTIHKVIELAPDSLAFYSYAHLPDRMPNQRLIKHSDLPSPEEKLELYIYGQELLKKNGYTLVGMDHFAKGESFLKGEITRNFMGYSDRKSASLLGLGASSIGSTTDHYVQNEKDVKKYEEMISSGKLPIVHGHALTTQEILIAEYIQSIFCKGEVTIHYSVNEMLSELQNDGLVRYEDGHLLVTSLGRHFLRNIAGAIDPLMETQAPVRFSQSV